MVSGNRRAGAKAIEKKGLGADVILMDDGLQNPSLAKDMTISVVDGERQFGNGHIIPAGPLRGPLDFQLTKTDLIVVNGRSDDRERLASRLAGRFHGPMVVARQEPAEDTAWLKGARVIAFAGIGNPARFVRLLEQHGATVISSRVYSDHHPYSDEEAGALLQAAEASGAILVTTEKDYVRLNSNGAQGALKAATRQLKIRLSFAGEDEATLMRHIHNTIDRRKTAATQPP
jgi:tetraacyldisaccharide 4'-kinase